MANKKTTVTLNPEALKALVGEAVKEAVASLTTPSRSRARETELVPVTPAGGAIPLDTSKVTTRRRGSFRELERRRVYHEAMVNVLKENGVFAGMNNLGAYTRIDLTAGNLALRGRHILVRQYDVAPEHPHVKKLLDAKEADYYLGAVAVAFIDDFKDVEDVKAWTHGLCDNVKARLASFSKK